MKLKNRYYFYLAIITLLIIGVFNNYNINLLSTAKYNYILDKITKTTVLDCEEYLKLVQTEKEIKNHPLIIYKLANCYFQKGDFEMASLWYDSLTRFNLADAMLQSEIYNQLGYVHLHALIPSAEKGMASFEKSLLYNPDNKIARYNLEICKTLLDGKLPPPLLPKDSLQIDQKVGETKTNEVTYSKNTVKRADNKSEDLLKTIDEQEQNFLKSRNFGHSPDSEKKVYPNW